MPTLHRRPLTLLLAVLAGCATSTGALAADSRKFYQAEERFPPDERVFSDDIERGFVSSIRLHHQRSAAYRESGNLDQARAEWSDEAQGLADFCDKFPSSEWRVSFRFNAAKLFLYAQQLEKAALQAEKVLVDEKADEPSRALAAKVASSAWLSVAFQKQKAGQLPPISLPNAEQRKGRPLAPVMPPGEWKRYVDASDAYLRYSAKDPEGARPMNERLVPVPISDLALRAAQVEYAFDNIEDARGRLERILTQWPDDADAVEQAAILYLQTFGVLKDDAGAAAAVVKLKAQLGEAAAKATDPKAKESLQKQLTRLASMEVGTEFNGATRLLEEGKVAESAAAYEAFLQKYPSDALVPRALNNGAIAFDRVAEAAKEPAKTEAISRAAALREQLLQRFPDSELAPAALLKMAEAKRRSAKYEDELKLYQEYVTRYPAGAFRCAAVQNAGVALENLKRPVEAAERFTAFASDSKCRSEDPNTAGKLFFRAAELFEKAKKPKQAKEAYQGLIGMKDLFTDVVVKSYAMEAAKRVKGL